MVRAFCRSRPRIRLVIHVADTMSWVQGPQSSIAEMVWDQLGAPFAVEVNADQSATGTHEMYSIFVEAKAASITLGGTRLAGHVAHRQLFGRTISTAFLAFSETWVKPNG